MNKITPENLRMGDLWQLAEMYGRPRLTKTDRGQYYCVIEFMTVGGTSLKSKSEFTDEGPCAALKQAILKAEEISSSFGVARQSHPDLKAIGLLD